MLAAVVKFIPIYHKIDKFTNISTNAARETEQLAFILLSGISTTLLGVHDPPWKFLLST